MEEDDDIVLIGDYEVDKSAIPLGEGSFGSVHPGKHQKTQEKIAAKVIPLYRQDIKAYAIAEVEILKLGKDHENIIQILFDQIKPKQKELWIIMEFCEHGNLSDYAEDVPLDLFQKMDIVLQTANGLVYLLRLEPEHVVHRDIKPANILIKSKGNGIIVRVSDFGVSKVVSGVPCLQTRTGTDHYKAPELYYTDPSYDCSVDVFSLGILILHLIRAKPLQSLICNEVLGDPIGEQMFHLKGKKESWLPIAFSMTDSDEILKAKRLIAAMIDVEPAKRLTMEQVHVEVQKIKDSLAPKSTEKELQPQSERASKQVTTKSAVAEEASKQVTTMSAEPEETSKQVTTKSVVPEVEDPIEQELVQDADAVPKQCSDVDERLTTWYVSGQFESSPKLGPKRLSSCKEPIQSPTSLKSDLHLSVKYNTLPLKPKVASTAPEIHISKTFRLKVDKAEQMVFGQDSLILFDKGNNKVVKQTFDGKEIWSKDVPKDMAMFGKMFFTSSLIVYQLRDKYPTVTYDADLEHQRMYTDDHSELRGAVLDGRLVYVKFTGKDEWKVDVFKLPDHNHVGRLASPDHPCKDPNICVDTHKDNKWLLVLGNGLDIYDACCNHNIHVDLSYDPHIRNGILAVRDFILAAGLNNTIRIYNWDGKELGVLTCEQLHLGGDKLFGIGASDDDNIVIATGPVKYVNTIHHLSMKKAEESKKCTVM